MGDQLYSLLSRCITETCLSPWNKTAVIDKNAEAGAEKFDFLWNIKEQVVSGLGCPLSLLAMFMDAIRQTQVFEDLFKLSIPHRLVSRSDVCLSDFPNGIDWQIFMKLYPDSGGLISCAWPVIDVEQKQALLHTGIESGPRIGAGGLSYYREENGIYFRKATYATWAQA